jgi:hypothetical protein
MIVALIRLPIRLMSVFQQRRVQRQLTRRTSVEHWRDAIPAGTIRREDTFDVDHALCRLAEHRFNLPISIDNFVLRMRPVTMY